MIGMLYVKLLEMNRRPRKSPYSRIREWKLFRKRIVPNKKGRKSYNRREGKKVERDLSHTSDLD